MKFNVILNKRQMSEKMSGSRVVSISPSNSKDLFGSVLSRGFLC